MKAKFGKLHFYISLNAVNMGKCIFNIPIRGTLLVDFVCYNQIVL